MHTKTKTKISKTDKYFIMGVVECLLNVNESQISRGLTAIVPGDERKAIDVIQKYMKDDDNLPWVQDSINSILEILSERAELNC